MNRLTIHTRTLALMLLLSACAEQSDTACLEPEDDSCQEDTPSSIALALLPPPPRFYANVNVATPNPADGSVTAFSSSSGASCSAEGCTVRIGSRVTLVATPTTGHGFTRWSGCSTRASPTLTISAFSTTTCTANFTTSRLFVRGESQPVLGGIVSASSGSSGASCSTPTYECLIWAGGSARLSVSAAPGYRFDGWERCSTSSATTLRFSNVQTSVRCIAGFSPLDPYVLNVSTVGPNGEPNAGGVYLNSRAGRCQPTSCAVTAGADVTLQPYPSSGYVFDHWSGCAAGNQPFITVRVTAANTQCVAHYRAF